MDRERGGRETEREGERDRQTDRQTGREREREREREKEREGVGEGDKFLPDQNTNHRNCSLAFQTNKAYTFVILNCHSHLCFLLSFVSTNEF